MGGVKYSIVKVPRVAVSLLLFGAGLVPADGPAAVAAGVAVPPFVMVLTGWHGTALCGIMLV